MSSNRVVLVTGSGRGIGAATARLFAMNGYNVCLNYRQDKSSANKVKTEIDNIGVNCIAVQADVSKESDVEVLFKRAEKLGNITVLVNNAGVLMQQSKIEDISVERFTEVLNINVLSCFLCTKQAIRRMSTKYSGNGGAIVNVSSGAAKTGSPFEYADYGASKGAMDTFTRGAAMELAEFGVRVNGVRPGLIYTDMHSLGGEPDRVDRLSCKLPLKRGGEAGEIAEAIYW